MINQFCEFYSYFDSTISFLDNSTKGQPCIDGYGSTREDGESWPCSDGCNTCGCNNGGIVSTKMDCLSTGKHCDGALLQCEEEKKMRTFFFLCFPWILEHINKMKITT